ncbi:hypothetical protein [Micromonospora sp. NPDC049497]|uniref:hypothetical protein n=1 Tax=Micromonospora sp. NPDC049497 TaxID=3364273 RepID=UPI0037ACB3A7
MTETVIHKAASPAVAVLRSPALWLGVALGAIELTARGPFDPYSPTTFIPPLLALIYLIFATFRHGADRSVAMRIQAVGLVCFTALSVVALVVDPALGRHVVAAGWLAHAAWDFAHRDGRVVPKWLVRFCMPFDLLVATSLVVGTWS